MKRPESANRSKRFAQFLERIELIRTTLRRNRVLEVRDISRLLEQMTRLRGDVMALSREERVLEPLTNHHSNGKTQLGVSRRQALLDREFVFHGILGENPALLTSLEIIERAAPSDLPVLIDGESGTGKELFAKLVHENSDRRKKAFVSVNCGAIPSNLIESELFGHLKGSFTGAAKDRSGRFEIANHGTIFLDEIGELTLANQVKLLRVLQSSEIQRVGSDETLTVNTRVVAATNRDLREMAARGEFREDLFYRLGVIHVNIPPLRQRRDEIPLLLDYFSDEAAEQLRRRPIMLSNALRKFLLGYDYPGNIRELRNIVLRLSCLADQTAELNHLPENIRPPLQSEEEDSRALTLADARKIAAEAAERQFLIDQLKLEGGYVSRLAKRLGQNRTYLQGLLRKHQISAMSFRKNTPPGSAESPTDPVSRGDSAQKGDRAAK